ncbi:MAG: bifunctional (p)ppGpp synthetase/guanosine-3',5'-bis(diphosphate) 3'-pyrophosphohydrolase [Mariprofundales bacterium]|nr:bifunctional (p)ppGpp synthetase/guanosine-3',5'-bis(diphosphate) 3'-pyrophosphohydrolase [Mariprofundales bacterium]
MSRIFEISERVRSYNSKADIDAIHRAYVFAAHAHAGQHRISGEPYISHPLAVASILSQLQMDDATIITGLLHDTVEDTSVTSKEIALHFGDNVARLVEGMTKIGQIKFHSSEHKQVENFRKMILATAKDLRVLMVKLADRMHNMRTLKFIPAHKQQSISQETLTLYAPLAHRMGIHWIRQEMEDIAFSYLDNKSYQNIKQLVGGNGDSLQQTKSQLERLLQEALADQKIETEVHGRLKHLYSLHQKMKHKHIDFDEIYDLVAFRIIVKDLQSCYHTLGIIHSLYRPIPGRFKDYIALPKPNGYQSLHTSIIGPEQHRIEVQIRTMEMHRYAENGVAAHWIYKDGITSEKETLHFKWLKDLTELLQSSRDPGEFLENARLDLFVMEVYVFSRDGDIISLPRGATVLDFAYAIHTDIGHHCEAAKINGERCDLRRKLHNGDQIEIITNPAQQPHLSWLQIARAPRSAQSIRQWFRRQDRQDSIDVGRKISDAILDGAKLDKRLIQHLECSSSEELYERVGRGEIALDKLVTVAQRSGRLSLRLTGRNRLMIQPAPCCLPIPGDRVLGLLEARNGLKVHYCNCGTLTNKQIEQAFEVHWNEADGRRYPTGIEIQTKERRGMLAAMTSAISDAGTNIADIRLNQHPGSITLLQVTVEVTDRVHLANTIRSLRALPGVIRVIRRNPGGVRSQGQRISHTLRGWISHIPKLGADRDQKKEK